MHVIVTVNIQLTGIPMSVIMRLGFKTQSFMIKTKTRATLASLIRANAVIGILFSLALSSSDLWSLMSLSLNFVNGHVSTM